ncbi:MAG: hypothetical protein HYX42_08205 [Polaromonas sp.]|uniref:hypothetical protein n=1 Tax=Polaromonas sp. TaxID=1869339 RepID=UPI0025E09314|nr:hypothetical protein [Polaromonas sp.]MBI2726216.1 hypothetical protein [Polaromonas sp.]
MNLLKSIVPLCLVVLSTFLAGCTDPEVKAVKQSRHYENMPTYGVILEDRADCRSLKWAVPTDDNGKKYVTATCTLSRSMASEAREQAISIAEKSLAEVVKLNKLAFDSQIRQAEQRVENFSRQYGGQDPSSIPPSVLKEQQEEMGRLSSRKEGANAYLAEVDARKDKALAAFKELLEANEPFAAEYYFQIRGEQSRIRGMRMLLGDKQQGVSGGDEIFSIMRLAQKDLASERAWWAKNLAGLVSLQSVRDCSYDTGCTN